MRLRGRDRESELRGFVVEIWKLRMAVCCCVAEIGRLIRALA